MKQTSFAQAEFAAKKKTTRRERFLAEMEQVVPWTRLLEMLKPHYYPDSQGKRGRPPTPLNRMLRMYFVQQWYALADEALEDAIYDSQALRNFVGVDLAIGSVPDATTLLKFRHLLEERSLTKVIFEEINSYLGEKGMLMREVTIVDATIIAAPPSTKNRAKARDPKMHQTKKGNQWHFGMKAHIGVDAASGLVHSLTGTAANVADTVESRHLLDGDEAVAYGDAGYTGVAKRDEFKDSSVTWLVAEKRGKLKKMAVGLRKELTIQLENARPSCGRRLNTRSVSSKTCSDIGKSVTGDY